jgi:hypothetical protein
VERTGKPILPEIGEEKLIGISFSLAENLCQAAGTNTGNVSYPTSDSLFLFLPHIILYKLTKLNNLYRVIYTIIYFLYYNIKYYSVPVMVF